MLLHEAIILSGILDRLRPKSILDCGSGCRADRTIVQPHIAAVFSGFDVTWTDIQPGPDIIQCDLTQIEAVRNLPRCEMVTACSLLEHVTDIDVVLGAMASRSKRWMIVTAPYSYPPHDCPVDNGWRPSPEELAQRVVRQGFTVIQSCASGPETFQGVPDASTSIVVAERQTDGFNWMNVRGWLTETEGEELIRLVEGKVVLEVGTFCGRSTLAMAETARKVLCIDTFADCPEEGMTDTMTEALCNIKRSEHRDKIIVTRGRQEDVLPTMDLSTIEVVFYDADHSEQSTSRGIRLLEKAGLPKTATVIFHDYHSLDPGVMKAVDAWFAPKGMSPRTVGSLAIFDAAERAKTA